MKDVLAYVRLALNPADDAAFLRVLARPPRPGLGPGSLARRRLLAGLEPTADLQFPDESSPPATGAAGRQAEAEDGGGGGGGAGRTLWGGAESLLAGGG